MTLSAVTPLLPALSAGELRAHLRNTNTEESALMNAYILAMQADIETCCERAVTARKYRLVLPSFPKARTTEQHIPGFHENGACVNTSGQAILLPRVPSVVIDSITYFDEDNESQEYTEFNLLAGSEPAELTQELELNWPSTFVRRDAVTVTFWAGNLVPIGFQVGKDDDPSVFTNPHGYPLTDGDAITLSFSGNSNDVLGDVACLPDGVTTNTTYYVVDSDESTFSVAATADGEAIVLAEPSVSGTALDLLFVGTIDPWVKLCLLQAAGHAYGQRCPQGGCVCSEDDFNTNPMYRRLKWRSPVEFV